MTTENERNKTTDDSGVASSDLLAILEACMQACDHQIPYYAYGDNQAACDMAHRLRQIGDDLRIVAENLPSENTEVSHGVRHERS